MLRIADIPMIEHGGSVQEDFENQNRRGKGADEKDDDDLDAHGQEDLYRMEANSGRHIEVHIGVVDHVKAPEERNGMEHDVLEVDGQVKDEHAEDNIQQGG